MADALQPFGLDYRPAPKLGGLRGRSPGVDEQTNAFWENRSFHNYADYALSDAFSDGLEWLLDESAARPCAIMCAEAVWWRCHRRIIADYLILHDRQAIHLMDGPRLDPARMTPGAVERDGKLVYPAPDPGEKPSRARPRSRAKESAAGAEPAERR
jgi:uncharacterized protein (DUF488 family)